MNHVSAPGRFNKCPAHMDRETAQSYLGRLTAFFGARSPKHFCRDYLLDLRGIQHGEPEALRRLAAMTGADPENLIRWTPRRIDKSLMLLNGETLHNGVNPRHLISICPVCATEDIAANPGVPLDQAVYGRCEWIIGAVDCCIRHEVRLVSHRAPLRTAEKLDVGYETGALLEELRFIQVEPAEPDAFQLYVLSRVGAVEPRPSPLLDPLPLATVTQLCHAAGRDLLRRRGQDGEPGDSERRAAGFEMLGHDVEGFERIFKEMRQGLLLSEMTQRIIGRLLEYLHNAEKVGRDLDAFVDVVVDVCFRNMPYAEGQVLLGRPCPKRWLYDFPSAMTAYNIGRHHLHAFVLGTPELAAYVGDRRQDSLIHADVADRLFLGRTPFLSSQEVTLKLGWDINPRHGLMHLMNAGVIQPETGASTAERPPTFSEPALEAAMSDFFARFDLVAPPAPGMVSTHGVTMTLGITNHHLWQLLASGKIRKLGRSDEDGLVRSMRLDIKEVLAAATEVEDPLTKDEVAAILGVTVASVRNLVAYEFLVPVALPENMAGKLSVVFPRRVVEKFMAEFVSPNLVRAMLPGNPSFGALRKMGLEPAIELEGQSDNYPRTTFFRRVDAEARIGEILRRTA